MKQITKPIKAAIKIEICQVVRDKNNKRKRQIANSMIKKIDKIVKSLWEVNKSLDSCIYHSSVTN